MKIYFPMTVNILTPGHIKCLEYLITRGEVVVGLLSSKALKGYKKEIVTYKDREFILKNLRFNFEIAKQDSLNPVSNLKKTKCDAIASGDGWEKEELKAIEKLGIDVINIKLDGEKKKKYSSSKLLQV